MTIGQLSTLQNIFYQQTGRYPTDAESASLAPAVDGKPWDDGGGPDNVTSIIRARFPRVDAAPATDAPRANGMNPLMVLALAGAAWFAFKAE